MKKSTLSCLALSFTVASFGAQGQTETLNYQGSPFTSVDGTGAPYYVRTVAPVPSATIGESLMGSLVLSSPLIANGTETVIPTAYEFSVGSQLAVTSDEHNPYFNFGAKDFSFTMKNGAIVGFNFLAGWQIGGPGGSELGVSGGSQGDTYHVAFNNCPPVTPGKGCFQTATSAIPGSWSVSSVAAAPEIDPGSAASALILLFGSVAVLRGRRRSAASCA